MDDAAELQRFAELLMRLVRDQAIAECDALADGRMVSPSGERWNAQLSDERAREAVRALIPEIVDEVLFEFLNALDQGDMELFWRRDDGSQVDLYDLGKSEMAGWFLAHDGWRARYSAHRFDNPAAEA
jgi:hypothetical protein